MLNLNDITFNKRLDNLIGRCFELPYVSYCQPLYANEQPFSIKYFLEIGKLLFTFASRNINMKCSEFLRLLRKDGWYSVYQTGSHVKLKHDKKPGILIFPNHGSQELGKGLEKKLRKDAGIK